MTGEHRTDELRRHPVRPHRGVQAKPVEQSVQAFGLEREIESRAQASSPSSSRSAPRQAARSWSSTSAWRARSSGSTSARPANASQTSFSARRSSSSGSSSPIRCSTAAAGRPEAPARPPGLRPARPPSASRSRAAPAGWRSSDAAPPVTSQRRDPGVARERTRARVAPVGLQRAHVSGLMLYGALDGRVRPLQLVAAVALCVGTGWATIRATAPTARASPQTRTRTARLACLARLAA